MEWICEHFTYLKQILILNESYKWWLTSSKNLLTTCLCFKLVSPSRLAVSIWHSPSGSLEESSSMSAGIISLQRSCTKSPTLTSFQYLLIYFFSFLEKKDIYRTYIKKKIAQTGVLLIRSGLICNRSTMPLEGPQVLSSYFGGRQCRVPGGHFPLTQNQVWVPNTLF